MVTCKVDSQTVAIPKMNSVRTRKPSSSNSSGLRLLDADHLESASSVSRNSVYKLKIDLMFDESRPTRSNRLDDPHGSRRTRSIIMYGRSELASTAGESNRSITSLIQESNEACKLLSNKTKTNVQRISNSVQEQIEQLFTDVAKDATSSFAVTYLGSLPLKDKVSSLQGLQEPLRELYLNDIVNKNHYAGFLDICTTGLRVKINENHISNCCNSKNNDEKITPFHNIAVWSAVKFVVSEEDGGAAFLPLITDPENIDKSSLFQPLSSSEKKNIAKSSHAPIFAVVMRSSNVPKVLECHAFLCKSTEDAIVIAATLYQSLMAHVNSNSHRSTKHRTPRNQNGVSCISIASSSAMTGSNYLSRSQLVSSGRKSSFRSTSGSVAGVPISSRSTRKKRMSNSSLSSSSNIINEMVETTTEERKRKSHKTKRAPPVPTSKPGSSSYSRNVYKTSSINHNSGESSSAYLDKSGGNNSGNSRSYSRNAHNQLKKLSDSALNLSDMIGSGTVPALAAAVGSSGNGVLRSIDTNGDILTRVAIPRSGSFLNTGGLTRYKSRAARRHSGKLGGGGGSPLGFSELFNEFRLHENLHSLDDILYAIIDADGMSFNDLKPIYKEFLMKLAVTLTKDELFQRSKNIMRRQKKKKLKRKTSSAGSQKKPRTLIFGTKSLKKVFQFGQFRSCRGKSLKQPRNKEWEEKRTSNTPSTKRSPGGTVFQAQHPQRSRVATSGSDVSVVRQDNTLHGLNRNSSSGYVSCSECSYDSEACTCISADRCYCSLKSDHNNRKPRKNDRMNQGQSKKLAPNKNTIYSLNNNASINRHSLISCKSDDKCYCSMAEDDVKQRTNDDLANEHSDATTWCDSDSCISTSKCYCQRTGRHLKSNSPQMDNSQRRRSRSATQKSATNKLALDYELFTISGNGKSVQPHEALSVKKSVEAAAIFADVKLSQTTDIKSMCPPTKTLSKSASNKSSGSGSCRSYTPFRKQSQPSSKKREACSIDRRHERPAIVSLSSSSSQKSCSADDLLNKLNAMENVGSCRGSTKRGCSKNPFASNDHFQDNYQSMKAVNASLEDTLGYLP